MQVFKFLYLLTLILYFNSSHTFIVQNKTLENVDLRVIKITYPYWSKCECYLIKPNESLKVTLISSDAAKIYAKRKDFAEGFVCIESQKKYSKEQFNSDSLKFYIVDDNKKVTILDSIL